MAVRFRNRSHRLLIIELNTRETIHLAPNEVSRPLEDFELAGNSKLTKLVETGVIESMTDPSQEVPEPVTERKSGRGSVAPARK